MSTNAALLCALAVTAVCEISGAEHYEGPIQYADEVKLRETIFKGYDINVRPMKTLNKPVIVSIKVKLIQLLDVKEKQQTFTSHLLVDQIWQDEIIPWNVSHYHSPDLVVSRDQVWIPEFYILNSLSLENILASGKYLQVFANGTILRSDTYILEAPCNIDVSQFPFDSQHCRIHIATWMNDIGKQVFEAQAADLSGTHESSGWKMLNFDVQLINQTYGYNNLFSEAYFTLHLRRKPLYHIVNIIIPSLMVSIMATFSFWLPPESGERVQLGVTTFLTFSVSMLVVAEHVPESSDNIPLVSRYIASVMTTNMIIVLLSVLASRSHFFDHNNGKPNKESPDRWSNDRRRHFVIADVRQWVARKRDLLMFLSFATLNVIFVFAFVIIPYTNIKS